MAHITGLGAFFIIVAVVVVLGGAGWTVYTHLRARRLGLPQPTLSSYNPFKSNDAYGRPSGGPIGFLTSKFNAITKRNKRSAGGAYEEPLSSGARGRNARHATLDPDEAWDARVGNEADAYGPGGYYEEQELGLHGRAGVATGGPTSYDVERGRSRSREPGPYIGGNQAGLDRRYDEEMGRAGAVKGQNPFGDNAEPSNVSLRGVSPRPIDTTAPAQKPKDDSPSERRSLFRENV
jgi:hypothetical protein